MGAAGGDVVAVPLQRADHAQIRAVCQEGQDVGCGIRVDSPGELPLPLCSRAGADAQQLRTTVAAAITAVARRV
ncbi:hypothetical protein BSL84_29735 [Streptomyces sp. TN58]|nr:hypothetical protein BSL84_29735 [Streptomyces sp. TN58]